MSAADHGPGTTIVGHTAPSSEAMARVFLGVPAALLARPSSPTPQTMASCDAPEPVMWISSTSGWLHRYWPQIHATTHDAQKAAVDQWFECGLQKFDQVVIDRIHLQNHDLVLIEQLVEHIQRRNGGDVAGTQHQGQLAPLVLRVSRVVGGRRVGTQIGRGHAGFHPDIHRDTAEQQMVPDRMRQYPRHRLAVGRAGEPACRSRWCLPATCDSVAIIWLQ